MESTSEIFDSDVVELTLEDGTVIECLIAAIYPVGKKQYIALVPPDEYAEEEGDVFLYGYSEDESGEPILSDIEDEDEYEAAADAFDELLDEAAFEEVAGDEEE